MKRTLVKLCLPVILVAVSGCAKPHTEQSSLEALKLQSLQLQLIRSARLDTGVDSVGGTCADFKNGLPANVSRGLIEVPEDWSAPDGRKIQVFYYVVQPPNLPGAATASVATPVVFFNGGPTADSHSSYEILQGHAVTSRIPLVFIDQRGTGCSDPFPSEPTSQTVQRLKHYGSRSIVKDAEAVRKFLYKTAKWRAFGQSYGGDIVHRYAMVAPEGLEAAYSHGASIMSDPIEWGLHRIRSQRRVAESYFDQFPNDRALVAKLQELISNDICFEEGTNQICGSAVLDAATAMLAFKDAWPGLSAALRVLVIKKDDGTQVLSRSALSEFVHENVFGIFGNNALAAQVVSKLEMVPGYSDAEMCKVVNERLTQMGEAPLTWAFNECRLLTTLKSAADALIGEMKDKDAMTPVALAESLTRNPSMKFFLYSSGKDVLSPVEGFAEERAATDKLLTYREFPNSGHEGFCTEPAIIEDLKSPNP